MRSVVICALMLALGVGAFYKGPASQTKLEETSRQKSVSKNLIPSAEVKVKTILKKAGVPDLYSMEETTEQIERKIQKAAQNLSPDEINALETIVINEQQDPDQRLEAAYSIKSTGLKGHASLLRLLATPSSFLERPAPVHSVAEAQQNFEVSLRIMALEGVEQNVHNSRGSLKISRDLLAQMQSETLANLLKLVFAGEALRRPLLREYIEKNLEKAPL